MLNSADQTWFFYSTFLFVKRANHFGQTLYVTNALLQLIIRIMSVENPFLTAAHI